MSALGPMLPLAAAQATGFALVGILVYLGLRRWSPAAGAQAALATLAVMAAVGLLAFLPLPGWSLPRPVPSPAATGTSDEPDRRAEAVAEPSPPAGPGGRAALDVDPAWSALTSSLSGALSRLAEPGTSPPRVAGRDAASWCALAMLAAGTVGMLRLATGLWSMRRLATRSRAIDDRELVDTLDLLRAEMGCVRPVRLRSCRELTSPATIGVGRPIILLPEGWQEWDADERRAVLAHELAHVCRGDFAAGLLAQVSLALQFYHPLAHWLLARQRLDQELAADAWSARLSGGNPSYLAVLARMALRQDDRPVTWPARAFLPSHGTLVRRIDMLRRKRPVRDARLSAPSRAAILAAMGGLGVLIAGLRPAPVAGQDPTPKAAPASPAVAMQPFDLSYLPAETRVVIAAQPAAILGRPGTAPLVQGLRQLESGELKLPVPAEAVEQIILFWEGELAARPQRAAGANPSGVILRFRGPEFVKAVLGHVVPAAEPVRHSGQMYHRPARNAPSSGPMSAFSPDGHLLILAPEDLLRTIIDDHGAAAPAQSWDEAWKQVQPAPVAAALDARWLRREYNRAMAGADAQHSDPRIVMVAPLLEKVHSYALGLDLDEQLRVHLAARTARGDDVKVVGETLQAVLTLARNALPALKQTTENAGPLREANAWTVGLLEGLLDKATLETAGQTVHLRSAVPVDAKAAGRIGGLFLNTARGEAGRAVSANHMKQVALAFHNYADANGHFPPPVVLGGKSGKVPHSWRVALLPYLAEQDLYRAYNFDEPWDGPNNIKLLERRPAIFGQSGEDATSRQYASYFALSGPDALLGKEGGTDFANVTDGLSNTILVVEAKRPVPWTKPEDIPFVADPNVAPPQLGGFSPDGFNAAFADGSVRFFKNSIAPHVLRALITRNGGEVVSSESF